MEPVDQRKALMALIRQAMPRVVEAVKDLRRQFGDDYVTECQRRGLAGEPGWFYAREGSLTVGVPWEATREMERELERAGAEYRNAAFVVLRPVESDSTPPP